jgi:drug/metabolite transporter (DMT)-like permease
MKRHELAMLLALAAMWGGSYLFIRVASPVFGPFLLMELRVAIAGAALYAYACATGRRPRLWEQWPRFLALGALNGALPFSLIAISELYIPASLAAILNATTPLFAALAAAIGLGDRLTRRRLAGLAVGLAGVGVLVGWSPLPISGTLILATLASLVASLAYGLGGTFVARSFRGIPSLTMAAGQQLGAATALIPFAVVSLPRAHVSGMAVANLLGLSLISTCVAYLIYYPLITSVGPAKALSVTFLIPVFGVLWGALFLHEAIGTGTIAGMLVILSSVTLVTGMRLLPRRPLPADPAGAEC